MDRSQLAADPIASHHAVPLTQSLTDDLTPPTHSPLHLLGHCWLTNLDGAYKAKALSVCLSLKGGLLLKRGLSDTGALDPCQNLLVPKEEERDKFRLHSSEQLRGAADWRKWRRLCPLTGKRK